MGFLEFINQLILYLRCGAQTILSWFISPIKLYHTYIRYKRTQTNPNQVEGPTLYHGTNHGISTNHGNLAVFAHPFQQRHTTRDTPQTVGVCLASLGPKMFMTYHDTMNYYDKTRFFT